MIGRSPRTADSTETDGTGAPSGFDRRLIPPMMLGAILNPVNSSIIAVSLVPIGRAFGTPASQTIWLVSALYVATAIGQPVVGRLVDLFGPRRLFLGATALTGLAGVIGTLAPDFWVLLVARVVLGFGTCAGYPAAMTLIRREADRTGQDSPSGVLTLLTLSSQTIAVIGPTAGGLLIGLGGWRTTFAINIPLAVIAFASGYARLPRDRRSTSVRPAALDLPGIGLFGVVLVSAMVVMLDPRWPTVLLLALTAVAALALVRREGRAGGPFLNLHVLAGNRPLLLTYVRMLLAQTIGYSVLYGYSQWLQDGRGLSPETAGLMLLPLSATALGVAALTGRRPEIRGKLLAGALTQVLLAVALLFVGASTALWLLVGLMLLAGIPQGLNNLALQNAVYHQADPATLGASSGLLRTFMYVGALVSSAATSHLFGATADTSGLHALAWLLAGLAVAFFALTALDRSLGAVGRDPSTTTDPHPVKQEAR